MTDKSDVEVLSRHLAGRYWAKVRSAGEATKEAYGEPLKDYVDNNWRAFVGTANFTLQALTANGRVKLVRCEPTEEMEQEGWRAIDEDNASPLKVFDAMFDAAKPFEGGE